MKKFLTIIFSIFVVLSFVGCATTKVEEENVVKHPESLHFEVTAFTGAYPNTQYKSLGIIEVPINTTVKYAKPEECDGLQFKPQEGDYDIGSGAKSFEIEYFVYEDVGVFRLTEIYGPNTYSDEIKKELQWKRVPFIKEHDRVTTYNFLSDHPQEVAKKFYEEVVLNQ